MAHSSQIAKVWSGFIFSRSGLVCQACPQKLHYIISFDYKSRYWFLLPEFWKAALEPENVLLPAT